MTALVLIAKEPLPGRAKTRLHPPLTLAQAANLAAACIDDTIAAVSGLPASRRILFYDGEIAPRSAGAFDLIPQPAGSLDERLAALFDQLTEPVILIGMDTPQVTAAHLAPVFTESVGVDAWFGPALDGGFWALGMREPDGDLIRGVTMSRDDTGAVQHARLITAGLRIGVLPRLRDVDTFADAQAVAHAAPRTSFAALLRSIGPMRPFAPTGS